ncbi:MAG: M60 family metallopeptidase, partial [Clostridia bacterium]|nr:M60 family metallopeptidase [Clostridia bacterium]
HTKTTAKASTAKTSTSKTATSKAPTSKTTTVKATAAKPADKTVKASAPKQEKATAATKAANTTAKTTATTVASSKAKTNTATEKKTTQSAPQAVVSKYSSSQGKQTTVVADVKAGKKKEEKQTSTATPVRVISTKAEAAQVQREKNQTIALWVLVGVLIAALLSGVILTAVMGGLGIATPFAYQYASAQSVGYYAETLGTVERNKPVEGVHDEGLSAYPTYGKTLNSVIGAEESKVAARSALVKESEYLCAWGTAGANNGGAQTPDKYTLMDKDGYLYQIKNGELTHAVNSQGDYRQLYKHTASVGLYLGNVDDNEPGIIKRITLQPRGYTSYNVTGVYAPAGEVIKIEISGADMNATGGIVVYIGQALYNGQSNNIWPEKNQMQRMPNILNTMAVTKQTSTYDEATDTYTAYVGSFMGGPIYIANEGVTFTATISGGVTYSHFILGYTTPQEFEQNAQSSAPYFDLEVRSYGVLHSGPKNYAKFSCDDLYKVAVLWEKVALVSTTNSSQGIVFIYDPFVAAGAAVAFPGRSSVNCPTGWMSSALNYKSIVSGGSWGNFHEYHHNFQNYGVGNGGEVTNNGMTLVSYSLFTKISSARGMGNYGASGMGDWNRYTSATWALEQTLKISRGESPENGKQGLALYATLLHNFGPDNYIQAKVIQQKTGAYGQNYAGYMQAWQDTTYYNMTYFFNDILGGEVSESLGKSNYPMFVPAASVYQTGRGILTANGSTEYIQTMQPYVIPFGDDFTIDLRQYSAPGGQYAQGSIILPDGFTYTVKNVTQPENGGSITDNGDGTYTYKPNKQNLNSGKIIVTLEVTKDDGAFEVDDIELVLGFEQTHEKNKTVLNRIIYTYDPSKMYTDAEQAYKADFKGYATVENIAHSNPTQNANTDIWFVPDTEAGHSRFPNALDFQIAKNNTITVLEGKLYFGDEGRYRIYLRGRTNCAVYYSKDGANYTLGATIKDLPASNSDKFRPNDPNSYFDVDMEKESWLYFKEVLITERATEGGTSYIGLGVEQWQVPMFTIQTTTDDKGNEVTKYFNYLGIEVSAAEANRTDPIEPASNKQPAYAGAYRSDYEKINNEFTSDYFYPRNYSYNYKDNEMVSGEQTLVSTNYQSSISWSWGTFPVQNLTDGNTNTFIHTKNNWGSSPERPLEMIIDLGEVKTVNRIVIYTQNRPNGDWHCPKNFILEGSIDGNTFTTVGEFQNVPRSGVTVTANFDETELRYYRLTVVGSYNSLVIIGEIQLWHVFEVNGAKRISPHDESISYHGKFTTQQAVCNYGQVYVGKNGCSVKFEFEGTRLGILSSTSYASKFVVYIDGKQVNSVSQLKPLKEQSGYVGLSFLSDLLEEGTHTVEIRGKGEFSIDSFAIYPNPAKKADQFTTNILDFLTNSLAQ